MVARQRRQVPLEVAVHTLLLYAPVSLHQLAEADLHIRQHAQGSVLRRRLGVERPVVPEQAEYRNPGLLLRFSDQGLDQLCVIDFERAALQLSAEEGSGGTEKVAGVDKHCASIHRVTVSRSAPSYEADGSFEDKFHARTAAADSAGPARVVSLLPAPDPARTRALRWPSLCIATVAL